MIDRVYGVVINVNAYGATVRLDGGELASAPAGDVEANRGAYDRAIASQRATAFVRHEGTRRALVTLAPQIDDPVLDAKIGEYLKATQEWDEDAEGRTSSERHFLQKKRRAATFDSES